ncbi:EAL domain-containing protein [Ramlibacter sp. 2FC]|uniref:putative bifunctional diguanylate cyclase/phosphodiesterase n=1 Tax=Ramlibacter sp. 2FC TaxID=2502188 RepID=UPI0010FA4970|nr:EAL domain-containing protein [Ramlibacter sp. 2FC]
MGAYRTKLRRLLVLLAVVITLLFAGIGLLQHRQWNSFEETMTAGETAVSWNFFQFEVEHLRFNDQLTQVLLSRGQGASMDQLNLRYQIFASRYGLIREGHAPALVAQHPNYAGAIAELSPLFEQAGRYFPSDQEAPSYDAATLQRLKRMSDAVRPAVRSLVLASNAIQNEQNALQLGNLRRLTLFATGSFALMALLAVAFGGLALRQMQVANRRSSDLEQLHREVSHRAAHDSLTKLVNRDEFERILQSRLESARNRGAEHAVLFMDLDRFKIVNDSCGHQAGDQLLRQVAELIAGPIRGSDTVARLGGDEFGVILENCTVTRALPLAHEICRLLDEYRFTYEGQRFHVSVSIGLVSLHGRWQTTSAVRQAADAACYAAKEEGRNRVHVYREGEQGEQDMRGNLYWVQKLENALDDGHLRLYWQRIMPLKRSRSSGIKAEILLRLDDNGQVIAPGAFLPAAEHYGMTPRLDRWVVHSMFEWMSEHAEALKRVDSLAINLSGQSIGDRDFRRNVLRWLELPGFPTAKLCFEITETSAITHLGDSATFFEALRRLGAKISLDDFGSGMSSFGYLKNLPADFLKIDGQFMRNLIRDPINQVTVRAICDVARATGKTTIAEWIENAEVAEMLQGFGVDYGQGYHWHRPEPLETLLQACTAPAEMT